MNSAGDAASDPSFTRSPAMPNRVAGAALVFAVVITGCSDPAAAPIEGPAANLAMRVTARDLGALGPADSSIAYAINDTGLVTGFSQTTGGDHATLWNLRSGTVMDLGVFPGGSRSYGYAINYSGVVVGFADTVPFGQSRAFRWTPGSASIGSLPVLAGGSYAQANGIN